MNMKEIQVEDITYNIENDFCGDCGECETGCKTGTELEAIIWTLDEVEEVCSLLKPSPYLSKLKNLEEMR